MINPYDYTQQGHKTPETIGQYFPQTPVTQPTLTTEQRLAHIEDELKEIKQILNEIRWRV